MSNEKHSGERGLWIGFKCGVLSTLASLSLWQDFLGQERYTEIVRNHWVSAWFTIPLALAMWALAITILVTEERSHARSEKWKGWRR